MLTDAPPRTDIRLKDSPRSPLKVMGAAVVTVLRLIGLPLLALLSG